jgi:hypothetical protein
LVLKQQPNSTSYGISASDIKKIVRETVEEVLRTVEYGNVNEALIMFQEFDQHCHIEVLKFIYYGYEPKN